MQDERANSSAKNESLCKRCQKFGHWYEDHKVDGSLPADMSCPVTSITNKKEQPHQDPTDKNESENRVIRFNNAVTASSANDPTPA